MNRKKYILYCDDCGAKYPHEAQSLMYLKKMAEMEGWNCFNFWDVCAECFSIMKSGDYISGVLAVVAKVDEA